MLKTIIVTLGIIIATSMLISGCATDNVAKESNISIESVDSSSVKITRAYLTKTTEGLNLYGELKRKLHSHGPIPGHVHIEIVAPNGKVIKTVQLSYSRKANSSHIAQFHTILPKEAAGNTVKIIHHDALSHRQENSVGVWQDADN